VILEAPPATPARGGDSGNRPIAQGLLETLGALGKNKGCPPMRKAAIAA
jgi:hypothetical protein